jgi:H+/Cl- antiporter ClcA
MLVLGSQSGLLFGTLYYRWFPNVAQNPTALDVVGMAGIFHRRRAGSGHRYHLGY